MGDTSKTTKTTQTQTQTRTPAPLTAEQQAINRMAAGTLSDYEKRLNDYFGGSQYALSQQVGQTAQQRLLDRLNGTSPLLAPQEENYLNQAFSAPAEAAMAAIRNQMVQEAQRRGMTLLDSPVGNSYLEAMRQAAVDFGAKRAEAGLNLGQQNYQQYSAAAQLAENIRQQVAQQQMALAQQSGNLQNQYEQQRLALAPVTTYTSGTQRERTSMPWSQGLANLGAAAQGFGTGLMGSTDSNGRTTGGLLNLIPGPNQTSGAEAIRNGAAAAGDWLWNDVIKGLRGSGSNTAPQPLQLSGPKTSYTAPPRGWFA